MIIYVCHCGDTLAVTENTEQSRGVKKEWKKKHGAPLLQKSPKRRVPERGKAHGHGYVRRVVRKKD